MEKKEKNSQYRCKAQISSQTDIQMLVVVRVLYVAVSRCLPPLPLPTPLYSEFYPSLT